jgi:hypothetical protein
VQGLLVIGKVSNLYQMHRAGVYLISMVLTGILLVEHASARTSFNEQHIIICFLSHGSQPGASKASNLTFQYQYIRET